MTDDHGEWLRLHPLTPVARIGRIVPAFVLLLVVSSFHSSADSSSVQRDYLVVFALASVVFGYVHWLVTRWRIEGDTLRIETGLVRRDSRRLPLGRIQAVDIVRPFLARMLGLSELRIRLAGSGSSDGRLAFLSDIQANELRFVLLSRHHEPVKARTVGDESPMATLTVGRLLGSVLLSLVTIVLVATIVSLVVLDQFEPRSAGALAGALAVYLLGFAGIAWRRLSGEYGFVAAEGPEGVSIRRGLFQTVSETIPYGRIQAVRQVEPWLWRPLGWCRLEVDIAGATSRNQRGEGSGVVRKALLPVGSQADSWHLIARLARGARPTTHRAAPVCPRQGSPQLPLPVGRPRRDPRRLRHRPRQQVDDLGAAGEVAEHPTGPGSRTAPARTGDSARGRRRAKDAGRVPRPRRSRGRRAGRGADRASAAPRVDGRADRPPRRPTTARRLRAGTPIPPAGTICATGTKVAGPSR